MKVIVLACLLAGLSAAKISPFIPREIVKHDVDVARVLYAKEKRDQAQPLKLEKTVQFEEKLTLGEETTTKPDEGESYFVCIETLFSSSDETNTVIPVVVGSLLGGLIVVVVVSYFIVRARRARE